MVTYYIRMVAALYTTVARKSIEKTIAVFLSLVLLILTLVLP